MKDIEPKKKVEEGGSGGSGGSGGGSNSGGSSNESGGNTSQGNTGGNVLVEIEHPENEQELQEIYDRSKKGK